MQDFTTQWGDIAPLIASTPFPQKIKAELGTYTLHYDFIGGMAVNDDYLFTSSEDGKLKIWHKNTLELAATLIDDYTAINFIALSADGEYLATCDDANQIKIFKKHTTAIFEIVHTLTAHEDYVSKLAFAKDKLVSASKDGNVCVWDFRAGKLLHTLAGHGDWVYALATSPDGRLAISSSLNSSLKLWDIQKGVLLEDLIGGSSLHYVMGMTIGGENHSNKGNREAPNCILWIEDRVVTLANDIAVWDTRTWEILWHIDTNNRYKIKRASYIPQHNMLITIGDRIDGWDFETGKLLFSTVGHSGEELYSCEVWNQEILYSGDKKGVVKVWDIESLLQTGKQLQHTSYVYHLHYTPSTQKIVTTAFDGTLICYDQPAEALVQLGIENSHSAVVLGNLPTQPKRVLIGAQGKLCVFDTETQTFVHTFALDNSLVNFDEAYLLSDTVFLGVTISYSPRLIDIEKNQITIFQTPYSFTHLVELGDGLILSTTYPTTPIDHKSKNNYSKPVSKKKPLLRTPKNLQSEIPDNKKSPFVLFDIHKNDIIQEYWLPEHIQLQERYDKIYPMYAYPIDKQIVVIQYSSSDLVVWDIHSRQVILVLSTTEEYLSYVGIVENYLVTVGKSGEIKAYNKKTFKLEKSEFIAKSESKCHYFDKNSGFLFFVENDTYLVIWDLQKMVQYCKINLKVSISKIRIFERLVLIGTQQGRVFSFSLL